MTEDQKFALDVLEFTEYSYFDGIRVNARSVAQRLYASKSGFLVLSLEHLATAFGDAEIGSDARDYYMVLKTIARKEIMRRIGI